MIDGSTLAHPYSASAHGEKTRTYRTRKSMESKAQKWADDLGKEVWLWEHQNRYGWGLMGTVGPSLKEVDDVA